MIGPLVASFGRLLCIIGLHRWSGWRTYGFHFSEARAHVRHQSRACSRCGIEDRREVIE